jgi:predicted PurR-regulated permease PerM
MDWHRLTAAIDDLLPRDHRDTILEITRDLDSVLAGFVRGQLTVCLLLGSFYAISLMVVGLKFGLLIGLFAGLISFIPFVGSITGGVISLGVAVAQFWGDPVWIAVVAAIFVVGQAVEGNFLTPKLVGGQVGLHPVWLLFALSAFGALFGFVGMLVAVPAAAAIGVVGRFLINKYKRGRLYRGEGTGGAGADTE